MRARGIAAILAIAMLAVLQAKAQAGQAAAPSPYPVVQGKTYKFEKVGDGVYYATGGVGGNHPIIVNDNDVMLVDDGTTPATARELLEDLKLITNKPVPLCDQHALSLRSYGWKPNLFSRCSDHCPRIRAHGDPDVQHTRERAVQKRTRWEE